MAISIFHFFLFLTLIGGLESSALAPAPAAGQDDDDCARISSCSDNGPTIRFPFRLVKYSQRFSQRCGGYPVGFELSCNDKKQTVLDLPSSVQVLVEKIDYKSQQIQVSAPDGGCLIGRFPNLINLSASPFRFSSELEYLSDYALYNCSPPARDSGGDPVVVPCLGVDGYRVYAVWANSNVAFNLQLASCVKIHNIGSVPYDIFGNYGSLSWAKPNCSRCEANGRFCRWSNSTVPEPGIVCFDKPKIPKDTSTQLEVAGIISGSFLILLSFVIIGYVYCSNKIERENQAKIERFLEDYRALRPSRYSHADIKRITHQFKDELGRGGYGTVYKGMLSNDTFVAIKVLDNSSNENGEDFINEVGTIGKIHHVNVVRLVGFCADGFTRALVYEFLPNESLEKYIFSDNQKNHPLGWEKLQDIALGIAKGIEYLHQGCDQRILHFDIKPQNILLDQNFNPKISDFGLAKLCSKEQSAVSMTAARGTMGYIAPEVLSRNFGKVSCKSDVYSYGMLLLEMVGGRKNVDVTVGNTSQMYFPEWVYKRLERGEELRIRIQEDGDASIARKLTIVGLRCIQWNPADRPSMKVVIQMLEGDTKSLDMPPNPFATANSIRPEKHLQQELEVISELE